MKVPYYYYRMPFLLDDKTPICQLRRSFDIEKVPVIKNEISHNLLICLATRMKGESVKVLAS